MLTEPSGSGKTTLLRILAGLTPPDRGSLSASPLCSMVFQEDRLCEEYSGLKNVELVTGDRAAAAEALGQLLEAEALERPCSELSGGMKRRVALVRALAADSDLLLLDATDSAYRNGQQDLSHRELLLWDVWLQGYRENLYPNQTILYLIYITLYYIIKPEIKQEAASSSFSSCERRKRSKKKNGQGSP